MTDDSIHEGPLQSLYRERVGVKISSETEHRHIAAMQEILSGYQVSDQQAVELLKEFDSPYRGSQVTVGPIQFHSICEHHLLPFWGEATITYVPRPYRLIGLSKFARLVSVYAGRLQTQEHLTEQIARVLSKRAMEVSVRVKSYHSCSMIRGVRQHDMQMATEVHLCGEEEIV